MWLYTPNPKIYTRKRIWMNYIIGKNKNPFQGAVKFETESFSFDLNHFDLVF